MIHILLVEDDKDLNQIVCRHLNTFGYQAIGCLNARDAYDQFNISLTIAEHFPRN